MSKRKSNDEDLKRPIRPRIARLHGVLVGEAKRQELAKAGIRFTLNDDERVDADEVRRRLKDSDVATVFVWKPTVDNAMAALRLEVDKKQHELLVVKEELLEVKAAAAAAISAEASAYAPDPSWQTSLTDTLDGAALAAREAALQHVELRFREQLVCLQTERDAAVAESARLQEELAAEQCTNTKLLKQAKAEPLDYRRKAADAAAARKDKHATMLKQHADLEAEKSGFERDVERWKASHERLSTNLLDTHGDFDRRIKELMDENTKLERERDELVEENRFLWEWLTEATESRAKEVHALEENYQQMKRERDRLVAAREEAIDQFQNQFHQFSENLVHKFRSEAG